MKIYPMIAFFKSGFFRGVAERLVPWCASCVCVGRERARAHAAETTRTPLWQRIWETAGRGLNSKRAAGALRANRISSMAHTWGVAASRRAWHGRHSHGAQTPRKKQTVFQPNAVLVALSAAFSSAARLRGAVRNFCPGLSTEPTRLGEPGNLGIIRGASAGQRFVANKISGFPEGLARHPGKRSKNTWSC